MFLEGGLNAGATGITVLAFAPGALSLSLSSGAPPSAHAATSAISNGDSDGSFAKSPVSARGFPDGHPPRQDFFFYRRRPRTRFFVHHQRDPGGSAPRVTARAAGLDNRGNLAIPRHLGGDAIVGDEVEWSRQCKKGPGEDDRQQPVVKVWRRTETGEAPRGQGATTENTLIFEEEQRGPGCSPVECSEISPRAARALGRCATFDGPAEAGRYRSPRLAGGVTVAPGLAPSME